jgi:excisionase family DNA binding protein
VRAEDGGLSSPRLLTVMDVARMLNVSKAQMFRILKAGQIPVVKIGRLSRLRPEAVEEYIVRMEGLPPDDGGPTLPRAA